ncbi:bifunctional diguanylate cyclase/phosphodiesterase [Marinobacter caseinilyticus]|uniref:bifunctional diguanylate cyclase/phosphodiesterase n=1 Tax=Marinobacter caseinilyticus TaxID=2692195 RepID=UPI00140BE497|nr:EAL domain-containing protein [Marinobacter caseinilyticus]
MKTTEHQRSPLSWFATIGHWAVFIALGTLSALFVTPGSNIPALWLASGYGLALLLHAGPQAMVTTIIGTLLAVIAQVVLIPAAANPTGLLSLLALFAYGIITPLITWWTYHKASRHSLPLVSYVAFLWLLGTLILASVLATLPLLLAAFLGPASAAASDTLLLQGAFGAFLGSLIIAPTVLALARKPSPRQLFWRPLEWLAWVCGLAFVVAMAAHQPTQTLFLLLPLMTWAATRFSLPGAMLAIGVAGLSGLICSIMSLPAGDADSRYLLSETLIAMMVAASCYVRVLLEDRERIENGLEAEVEERTRELQLTNYELKDEIFVRQQAEKSFRRSSRHYRALFETAGNPIIVIDDKIKVRQWNGAAEALFGYSRDEAVGRSLTDTFIPSTQKDELTWKILKVLNTGLTQDTIETEIRDYSGSTHIILWNLNRLHEDEDDGRAQMILIGQDISEIRRTQDQLHYLAHYDVLTDTANRRLFEDRCRRAITSSLRHGHHCALIGLDIDHFKRVNDTLGHDAGDRLLQELARRLRNSLREEDTIARLGGDEFAVLLNQVNGAEGCDKVARALLDAITQPIEVPGGELVITSSIGITLAPEDGNTYEDLLKNADMAMYRAKKAGRNNIQFFSSDMNIEMQRQMTLERELREGIKMGQMELHYQPILCVKTGRISGLEALLRWNHPTKGLLSPQDFIDVAEQTGHLQTLGEWVCHNACLQARAIQTMSGSPITININLSSRQYNHPRLADQLDRIINETRIDPALLLIEIDERTLSDRLDETAKTLQRLKQLGLGLVLDRFGSGLSSLRLLRDLPFDQVKIDQHLLHHAPYEENTGAIVHTLINLARQLSLTVVAAGIETADQDSFLRKAGCHLAQGHRFCPAVSSEELASLFHRLKGGHSLLPADQYTLPLPGDASFGHDA